MDLGPFLCLLALPCLAAPTYSAATVVNSATGMPQLTPGAFATVYGKDLATGTHLLMAGDMPGGRLPIVLPGTGVSVFLDGLAAPIWYASPDQVNFIIPPDLVPGREAAFWLAVDGRHGPEVLVRLAAEAPGLFASNPVTALAVRLDASRVDENNPAVPGDDIVLFATGLGSTLPPVSYREVAQGASPLLRLAEFRLLLNGLAVPPGRIRYAGAAPGFAGLYQINLWIPPGTPANPEIRIALGPSISPAGLRLSVR
ncbi:MAG: hypothetical protein HYZ37_00080 [Candidatus Solibacter usitatus]|nr:hypothetical protein [Candidatus Solibacter usitatus]